MKKIALIAAVAAFPAITFAGGSGADLSQYTSSTSSRILNFDPSVSAVYVQPHVGAIGSTTDLEGAAMLQTNTTTVTQTVTPTRTFQTQRTSVSTEALSGDAVNRAAATSSMDILTEREKAARTKLLRYRSLGY